VEAVLEKIKEALEEGWLADLASNRDLNVY
jgi:hypothetical protein